MNFAYYNEIDKNASAWLRQLIKDKLIMDGEVDERSITEVEPSDLTGFTRVHFFAGIAGWDYALKLSGWPEERSVWTGSAPCQPFSIAGKQKGKEDERHLWPEMYRLIRQCRPEIVFGEQVESAIRHGWLDDLCDDFERESYTVRAQVLTGAGIGAPHIRKRLYWCGMGNPKHYGCSTRTIEGGDDTSIFYSEERPDSTSELKGTSTPIFISTGVDWLYFGDGKNRPIGKGINPIIETAKSKVIGMANGIPTGMVPSGDKVSDILNNIEARVVRLKGYGNAIIPQVAASFIESLNL